MKKYSADYFESKFNTLKEKLLIKEGFVEEIRTARKELEVPVQDGFASSFDFAKYITDQLSFDEMLEAASMFYTNKWEVQKKRRMEKKDQEEVFEALGKEIFDNLDKPTLKNEGLELQVFAIGFFDDFLKDHHGMFFLDGFIKESFKNVSKFIKKEFEIFNKFFRPDLYDEHIILSYVERYLFLGENGINDYIKKRVVCPACKNIGVAHFSPTRDQMEGKDEGIGSNKYIFNQTFVKQLSMHFNSVFLIIKPYAEKDQVKQYIEDNWEHMKEHMHTKNTYYKQFGVGSSRIKTSDFEKNELVYKLNKLSKAKLLKLYTGAKDFSLPSIYKEIIVAAILEEQHNISMTADAVKKAAARYAEAIKVIDEPRAIGDI